MAYNLLKERWIPVRRRSGASGWIAPHEMVDRDDPPVRLAWPRPDLDSAVMQFLIGLLQTCAPPSDELAWRSWLKSPPSQSILREVFAPYEDAFILDGDGPRFMQDLDPAVGQSDPWEARKLLVHVAGNKAMFVDLLPDDALGYPAAAAALFALQANAPSGGAGHRTSLRGGGPLTCVVVGRDLFRTAWSNVLDDNAFRAVPGNRQLSRREAIFPWMGQTRTSAAGQVTAPNDVHPLHHYWAMPRRIRLETAGPGTCALTGRDREPVVRRFFMIPSGFNYKGAFQHPLTPYYQKKPTDLPLSMKPTEEGLPYRYFPSVVSGVPGRIPATVVRALQNRYRPGVPELAESRMELSGYDMGQATPRGWYCGTTPLLLLEESKREAFAAAVAQLVAAAELVAKTLVSQLRDAIARRPKDKKYSSSTFAGASHRFWLETEAEFYRKATAMRGLMEADDDPSRPGLGDEVREQWLEEIHKAALRIFSDLSQEAGDFASCDVKRVVTARRALETYTRPDADRVRKEVGLAPKSKEAGRRGGNRGRTRR